MAKEEKIKKAEIIVRRITRKVRAYKKSKKPNPKEPFFVEKLLSPLLKIAFDMADLKMLLTQAPQPKPRFAKGGIINNTGSFKNGVYVKDNEGIIETKDLTIPSK